LADSLITHGIALARLGKKEQAQFTFQRAIEVACQVGALNKAGLAALTLIEEIDNLPLNILAGAYEQAGEWLADCQSREPLLRFKEAGKKLALALLTEPKTEGSIEDSKEFLFHKSCRLPDEVLKFERSLISQTLAKVNGSVTYAAKLLGVSYQRLAYILETRHKDLLKERTPVRRRSRKVQ
jgi:DNA-binding NtrC family response regulator